MTLWAYRDTQAERLVGRLAATLVGHWPADPMAPVTVVIGSRGMQRWLSHELATLHGSVAAVDFLFPGNAFGRAIDAIHAAAGVPVPVDDGAWKGTALHRRVIRAVRARLSDPAFARVHRYLGDCEGPVAARELAFTREVATVLERLLYDRPDDAAVWMTDPAAAPDEHRWLAQLLADLKETTTTLDPPSRIARLRDLPTQRIDAPLFVFGLSSLRNGDKVHIAELARHMDIHLFMLVPSTEWWADIRLRGHERAALRAAKTPAETIALLQQFERSNQMLAAHGAPSRDLQLWLEELGYQTAGEDPEPDEPRRRLEVLQRWIDTADEAPGLRERMQAGGVLAADAGPQPSIEINACHGALRQCEALRDDLLRRFAADPSLEPRHVLVMTPDLATYAPLIAAVFGREHHSASAVPAIPVHIADLGLTDTNPVAAVLLDVIGLVGSRVTASGLLDLLGREPLRTRFRIDDDDLGALKDLIISSGLRWAWDAEDRARHDQPAVDQNTVRFALERLALGALMPDPGGVAVVPAAHGLGPAVPVDLPGRDQALRFGVLAEVCDHLQRLQQTLVTPATAEVWRARLERVMDTLCALPESRAWQRVRVSTTLQELLGDDVAPAAATPVLQFDPTSIAAMLRDAFTLPRGGDRPNTGAVTVCAMEPMRSVPFRVVAMIGMDDDSFPRPSRPTAWDPFATPKPQEHDRRSLDRHLFLESLLCARDALLIYGRGFEATRGEEVPLSVVVEELADLLAQALDVATPRDLLRVHPLQPWSLKAFEHETRRPFDVTWADAALARQGEPKLAGLAATPADAEWPAETETPTTLTARELARALENAPRAFLEKTLGISMTDYERDLEDREPIELDDLEAWKLRDALIDIAAAGDAGGAAGVDVRPLLRRQQGEGAIPFEAGGEAVLSEELSKAQDIVAEARKVPGTPIDAAPYACTITAPGCESLTVTAVVPEVREESGGQHHVWLTASSDAKDKFVLEVWFAMLVARAADAPVITSHVFSRKRKPVFNAPDKATAERVLEACVALWWRARRQPVPLVPHFSRHLADLADKTPELPPQSLVQQGVDAWFEDDRNDTAMSDDAARGLFGGWTEEDLEARADRLVALAQTVWSPMHAATEKKADKGKKR